MDHIIKIWNFKYSWKLQVSKEVDSLRNKGHMIDHLRCQWFFMQHLTEPSPCCDITQLARPHPHSFQQAHSSNWLLFTSWNVCRAITKEIRFWMYQDSSCGYYSTCMWWANPRKRTIGECCSCCMREGKLRDVQGKARFSEMLHEKPLTLDDHIQCTFLSQRSQPSLIPVVFMVFKNSIFL